MIRKAVFVVLFVVGLLALGFGAMVWSSMSYDRSDPRARPNVYHSVESAVIDRPVADVFRFIQSEIPSVYARMSPMHEKFEIVNAVALVVGAEVDVWDYFDFEPLAPNRTRLTQTVVLEMKSPVLKSIIDIAAFVSGTRGDWERQFSEQLRNLAAFAQAAPDREPGEGAP